jgi:AcrR family transcriptional regulator
MPKVTQAYLDARREQILDAARRCFVRNGFHETSMQDVFAESGLSAGAVYRYFKGKDDMIVAIAEQNMRDVIALIHTLATQPHAEGLGAALAEVLDVVRDKHAREDLGAMAVLVWSEQLRNSDLAKQFETSLNRMRDDLAEVVRGHQKHGAVPKGAEPQAVAGLLMAIIPGFILQLALFGEDAASGIPAAVRALWPS